MKVIMIEGESRVGKTTALNAIYDKLLSNGGIAVMPKKQEGSNEMDFSSIIDYNGKKIAFFTMGDYARQVKGAIMNFNSCDYVVCACNSNFSSTINLIKEKYDTTIILKKSIEENITNNILAELSK